MYAFSLVPAILGTAPRASAAKNAAATTMPLSATTRPTPPGDAARGRAIACATAHPPAAASARPAAKLPAAVAVCANSTPIPATPMPLNTAGMRSATRSAAGRDRNAGSTRVTAGPANRAPAPTSTRGRPRSRISELVAIAPRTSSSPTSIPTNRTRLVRWPNGRRGGGTAAGSGMITLGRYWRRWAADASWTFLAHQPFGLDVEDLDANHDPRAVLVDDAHVDELRFVGRPVQDPAARPRARNDAIAGPRLRSRLQTGRNPGDPHSTLAELGQVSGRHVESRGAHRWRWWLRRWRLRRWRLRRRGLCRRGLHRRRLHRGLNRRPLNPGRLHRRPVGLR